MDTKPETAPKLEEKCACLNAYRFVLKQKHNPKPAILSTESGSGVISGIYGGLQELGIPMVLILHHNMPELEKTAKNLLKQAKPCAILFDSIDRDDTGKILAFMRTHARNRDLRLYATWNPKPGVWDSVKNDAAFQVISPDNRRPFLS